MQPCSKFEYLVEETWVVDRMVEATAWARPRSQGGEAASLSRGHTSPCGAGAARAGSSGRRRAAEIPAEPPLNSRFSLSEGRKLPHEAETGLLVPQTHREHHQDALSPPRN